jgi:hypothetical protein
MTMYIRVSFSFKISLCVELRIPSDQSSVVVLNIRSIRYDTVNPPNTLIAETAIAVQPRTFVADPLSWLAMRIPPNMTTPKEEDTFNSEHMI